MPENRPGQYDENRRRMVEKQIRQRGVANEKVLRAMSKVERHLFVAEEMKKEAYADYPLPIGSGQTISQPYIVAYMTEAVCLEERDRVLEIGTGSGYQSAVLAEIAKEVFSIETVKKLADRAREDLKERGYKNIKIKHDDGYKGWEDAAPFDAIVVTAAPTEVPEELKKQLKVGGRMIIPVGDISQQLRLIVRIEKGFEEQMLLPVRFVPMVKRKEE